MLVVTAAVPALVASSHASLAESAARDDAVVQVLGLGAAGPWRSLGAVVAAPLMLLPLGTRVTRGCLASALGSGLACCLVYFIAKSLAAMSARAPRIGAVVAAIAALTVGLSGAWQMEGAAVGGATLGALVILAPLAIVLARGALRSFAVGFAVGLAFSYDPLSGLTAAAAPLVLLASHWKAFAARQRLELLGGLLLGLTPLLYAALRRDADLFFVSEAGPGSSVAAAVAFAPRELGAFMTLLALAGAALTSLGRASRPLALALIASSGVGLLSVGLGSRHGPLGYDAPGLAALGALAALSAVTMQWIVRAVLRLNVPLAGASAAMVVVLLTTFPVLSFDDALRRIEARPNTTPLFEDVAWGDLPDRSVLLVGEPRLLSRVNAARSAGEFREDLLVVPMGNAPIASLTRLLALEPALRPLYRDLVIGAEPDEWALSSLASSRRLALPFQPAWPRPLVRHQVPAGLLSLFQPEPRGAGERRGALLASADGRSHLLQRLASAADPALVPLTRDLLLERALALASVGERDLASDTLAEIRLLVPGDVRARALESRIASSRGAIDVKDLLGP